MGCDWRGTPAVWPGPSVSAAEVVLASSLAAVGAFVFGSVGIGMTLVAGPAFVLIDSDFTPAPLLFGGLMVTLTVAVREREAIELADVRWAFVGIAPGVAVGYAVLAVLSNRALALGLGTAVVIAVALVLLGWQPRRTKWTMVAAGATSAATATAAALPGPPMAIAYSDAPGPTLRATLAAFFTVSQAIALVVLVAAGEFGGHTLGLTAAIAPGTAIGIAGSSRGRHVVDRRGVRPIVLGLSLLSGLVLIARHLA